MSEISYRGAHDGSSGAGVVSVYDGEQLVGLLTHHVKHSPTGFSWGYGGSGPAELARCLLIDALGPDALCTTCGGSGEVVWDPAADRFARYDPDARYPSEVAETRGRCDDCERGIGRRVNAHYLIRTNSGGRRPLLESASGPR